MSRLAQPQARFAFPTLLSSEHRGEEVSLSRQRHDFVDQRSGFVQGVVFHYDFTGMPNRFTSCLISCRKKANEGMMNSKSCIREGS